MLLKIGARSGVYAIAVEVVAAGGVVEGGGVVAVVVPVPDAGFVGPNGTPFEHPDAIQMIESATASPPKVACLRIIG